MSKKIFFEQMCAICLRGDDDNLMLGPFVDLKTISAHFLCVRFSPVTPQKCEMSETATGSSMAGVTSRFIRNEGARSKKLVTIFFGNKFKFKFILFSAAAAAAMEKKNKIIAPPLNCSPSRIIPAAKTQHSISVKVSIIFAI